MCTCHKEKGVICRFGETTRIVHIEEVDKSKIVSSKKILNKALLQVMKIDDSSTITLPAILGMCSVSIDDYNNAVADDQKRLNIIYKQKPAKINTVHCNAVILKLLRANMNIQFVTRVYAMLVYLTLYLSKPEHATSKLMKRASKEAQRGVQKQLEIIQKIFFEKREIGSREATKRTLSMSLRKSQWQVSYILTGNDEVIRMLKSQEVLNHIDEYDTDVFAQNLLDRYVSRPDFDQMCYADFTANYVSTKAPVKLERDNIRSYTEPAGTIYDYESDDDNVTIS